MNGRTAKSPQGIVATTGAPSSLTGSSGTARVAPIDVGLTGFVQKTTYILAGYAQAHVVSFKGSLDLLKVGNLSR